MIDINLYRFIFNNYRHPKPEALQNAKQLAINLIQTMQSELQAFIQQQPPPVQPQQVLEAPPIQQIQQGIIIFNFLISFSNLF